MLDGLMAAVVIGAVDVEIDPMFAPDDYADLIATQESARM